ncbi:hypothetical protein GALL_526720 [mine drainage metagenome]|uniref:Uncharacterized protein n=1 Tax=mine drainage metagenome TaxID=410659 RepID=A0A1J5P3M3_9ZZZZ
MQGGLAAANRERSDTAFEFSDACFQNRTCWIRDPAVAITLNLQIK